MWPIKLLCAFLFFPALFVSDASAATSCNVGYYLSGSTCIICPKGSYCPGGTSDKLPCTGITYSDSTGMSACKKCPTATKYANLLSQYVYWTENGVQDTIDGCHMYFTTSQVDNGSVVAGSMLCYLGTDGDYGTSQRVCQVLISKIKCDAGYWNFQHDQQYAFYSSYLEMIANVCKSVGEGYYSAAQQVTRTACPTGETTIGYGIGADESADCGHKLKFGDKSLHFRSVQRTNPALKVFINNKTFYADTDATNTKGNLRIKRQGTIYSIYDDSM